MSAVIVLLQETITTPTPKSDTPSPSHTRESPTPYTKPLMQDCRPMYSTRRSSCCQWPTAPRRKQQPCHTRAADSLHGSAHQRRRCDRCQRGNGWRRRPACHLQNSQSHGIFRGIPLLIIKLKPEQNASIREIFNLVAFFISEEKIQ